MSDTDRNLSAWRSVAVGALVLVLMMGTLRAMGRVWWCDCGQYHLWSMQVWSSHNSQHLADAYFGSHVQHGLLFYAFFRWALGTDRPVAMFAAASALEAAWEVLENTPLVINRYRENTASLDYFGDSIWNSIGDLGACWLGYWIAMRVPWKLSVAAFVVIEIGMVLWIRDSLLLNVLMLVWPLDVVREWQMVGAGG